VSREWAPKFVNFSRFTIHEKLSSDPNDEVCDATADDSSTTAGKIKTPGRQN